LKLLTAKQAIVFNMVGLLGGLVACIISCKAYYMPVKDAAIW